MRTTPARPRPDVVPPLPGLELMPAGVAYQVQSAHDAQVGALEVLLAESRQDADRNAELYRHAIASAAAYRAQAIAYLDELGSVREELAVARPALDEARRIVAAVHESREGATW